MSAHYKRFLKLLEKWPIDKSKGERDFGEHLRKQLKATLRLGSINTITDENLDKQYEALSRLSKNIYADNFKRKYNSTATGLSGEQCNQVLSAEFLEYLKEQDRSIFSRKTFGK